MIWLILGVALWWAAHLFKRVAPERRARMGDPGKGAMALAIGVSVVLMVIGYRAAAYVPLWVAPLWTVHLNNLMMVGAFYFFAIAGQGVWLDRKIRHSMLTGMSLWALAHLIVNGDLASLVLFGGLLAWALAEVMIINRAEPGWTPPPPAVRRKEFTFPAASVVAVLIVGFVHSLVGPWPFGG